MRRLLVTASCLALACAADPPRASWPPARPAQAPPGAGPYHDPDHRRGALPDAAAREHELAFVRDHLDRMYAHRADKLARYHLNEDALFGEAERRLVAATSWAQYDAAIYDALAQFHDSHLAYHPPPTAAPARGYDPYRLGLETALAGDRVLVASVEPGSDVAAAGVKPGDEVTAVDGEPIAGVLARQVEQRAWSRPESATAGWNAEWTHVLAPRGEAPRARSIVVATRDGRTVNVAIAPRPAPAKKRDKVEVSRAGAVAIVAIHALEGRAAAKQIDDALAAARGDHRLVIDLRGDRGGVDVVGQRVLADLAEGHAHVATYRVLVAPETLALRPRWKDLRGGPDGFSAPEDIAVDAQPAGRGFHGALAVVVDAGCVSTCEVIAAALRADLHAAIVGAITGGSSGAPVAVALPVGKGDVAIPTWNLTAADGTAIESNGLQPDVAIAADADSLAAGIDRPLQAAIDAVNRP